MWPRLQSTQFGLLDDGVTIKMAQSLSHEPLKAFTFMRAAGRFLPAYWFTEILIYQWAGVASLRWFYVNFLVLMLDTLAIFWIVRFRTGALLQSLLAGLFFCLSSPIIETFYTLSKPDLIMASWLIWGFLFALLSHRSQKSWTKRGFFFSTVLFLGFLLRRIGRQKWPATISVTILAAIISHFIFQYWLDVQLPRGFLGF